MQLSGALVCFALLATRPVDPMTVTIVGINDDSLYLEIGNNLLVTDPSKEIRIWRFSNLARNNQVRHQFPKMHIRQFVVMRGYLVFFNQECVLAKGILFKKKSTHPWKMHRIMSAHLRSMR